jgi:hypothetical protein
MGKLLAQSRDSCRPTRLSPPYLNAPILMMRQQLLFSGWGRTAARDRQSHGCPQLTTGRIGF